MNFDLVSICSEILESMNQFMSGVIVLCTMVLENGNMEYRCKDRNTLMKY